MPRPHSLARRLLAVFGIACAAMAATVVASPVATAQAQIDHIVKRTDRWLQVFVHSPAMRRIVQVDVLLPVDVATPHPTLYLLDGNGSDASAGQSTWTMKTDAVRFFADKPVTVVLPVGGGGTFYTNWLRDDPGLGHNQWETFLAQELPPLIDTQFHGNGANAVAGVSMGGQAALALAFRNPALYRSVAAYSGCLFTSNIGQGYVRGAVAERGGNADNMWGKATDPEWPAHDVSLHTNGLRGKPLFVSTSTGVPGPADGNFDPSFSWPTTLAAAIALEQGANDCTVAFDAQLRVQNIPATVKYYPIGTHSWPYWQAPLHDSWPVLARGIAVG
ncbi:alpha/beta hydrolase [Nocardia amamiensis]|uniref:alpha/beta hydrolase n=1 Tax=Nocardia amamiensis TaxID=404578 RepID=UPI001FE00648|nr:alpha/beta hydrolase family protein [Nocardia amamiensis]